jgi:sugar phosphate isomerase/epimerase
MLLGLIPFATPAGLSDVEDARWRVQRAAALGLDVIQTPLRNWDDAYLKFFRDIAGEQGIELEAGIGPDFVSRSPLSAEELAPLIATIRAARLMEMRILRVAGAYTRNGRFFPPAVTEQLGHYATNLRALAPHAEDAGILLAVENHCDFRGVEIAQIIEQTHSPAVRAALDTGNGFITYNDPLDDARALAPYAVTTHLKDMRVETSGEHPPWPIYGALLGQGHVDLDAAVHLLATQSPDPARLRLILEWWGLPPGQEMTFEEWYTSGIAYVRERFAAHLTTR